MQNNDDRREVFEAYGVESAALAKQLPVINVRVAELAELYKSPLNPDSIRGHVLTDALAEIQEGIHTILVMRVLLERLAVAC